MPFDSISELPQAVLDRYGKGAQRRAFMAAFNSSFDACDGTEKECEGRAMAAGHTAAQNVKALRNAPKMAALTLRSKPELIAVRNFVKSQLGDGDYTADDKFHVTMVALLDETEHPSLPNIKSAPIELKVNGLEIWDVSDGAKAAVLTLERTPELDDVQIKLFEHYTEFEKSKFSTPDDWQPHITLGYFDTGIETPTGIGEFTLTSNQLELVQGGKTISRKRFKATIDMDGNIYHYGDARYSQLEAGYDPLGGDDFEACASCRWFMGNHCGVVQGDISPTGISNLYAPLQSTPEIELELGFMSRLKTWFSEPLIDSPSGFKVLDGGKRWLAWYTNAYEDKEGEIFPTVALQRDVDYMWKSGEFPELWFYHIPGTKHGQSDWVGLIGRFVVATGEFDDSALAKALIATYDDETVSHGFVYNEKSKVNGAYWEFHTFEISPTPQGAEANPLTKFEVKQMAVSKQQVAELEKRLGKTEAAQILSLASDATTKADESGIAFKSTDEGSEGKATISDEMESRMAAMEASIAQMAKAVTTLASAKQEDEDEEDMEDDDEEKGDDEMKSRSQQKQHLTDDFKAMLIADYEKHMQTQAAERKLENLPAADQIVSRLFGG